MFDRIIESSAGEIVAYRAPHALVKTENSFSLLGVGVYKYPDAATFLHLSGGIAATVLYRDTEGCHMLHDVKTHNDIAVPPASPALPAACEVAVFGDGLLVFRCEDMLYCFSYDSSSCKHEKTLQIHPLAQIVDMRGRAAGGIMIVEPYDKFLRIRDLMAGTATTVNLRTAEYTMDANQHMILIQKPGFIHITDMVDWETFGLEGRSKCAFYTEIKKRGYTVMVFANDVKVFYGHSPIMRFDLRGSEDYDMKWIANGDYVVGWNSRNIHVLNLDSLTAECYTKNGSIRYADFDADGVPFLHDSDGIMKYHQMSEKVPISAINSGSILPALAAITKCTNITSPNSQTEKSDIPLAADQKNT